MSENIYLAVFVVFLYLFLCCPPGTYGDVTNLEIKVYWSKNNGYLIYGEGSNHLPEAVKSLDFPHSEMT